MQKLTLDIKPKEGFGELNFGDQTDKVVSMLGEAEELESIEDDDEFNTTILNYWEQGFSVFFEGVEKSVLSCFETDSTESILYGKRIFDLNEEQLISIMKEKGYEVAETEEEGNGERRISYDDALIDFFFHEGELLAVNWGVLVNEQGEIEEF